MTSLKPKLVSLRLNYEQVQHIVDGIIENRRCIEPQFLHVYDEEGKDIFSQLNDQGIHIDFEENDNYIEPVNTEMEQAKATLTSIKHVLQTPELTVAQLDILGEHLVSLEKLMFG